MSVVCDSVVVFGVSVAREVVDWPVDVDADIDPEILDVPGGVPSPTDVGPEEGVTIVVVLPVVGLAVSDGVVIDMVDTVVTGTGMLLVDVVAGTVSGLLVLFDVAIVVVVVV